MPGSLYRARGTAPAPWSVVRATELSKQLEDMRQRLQAVIGDLNEVRAKVALATEGVERQAAVNRLMTEGVWDG